MSDKVYTSSFSGAQIDEAVDKVINGDIEGSNIKEGSIPLSALVSKEYMLNGYICNEIYYITELTSNDTYFNVPESCNVVYLQSRVFKAPIEIVKGTKITISKGPVVIITYDDNGIKINSNYSYYGIKVYAAIKPITTDWNAQQGEAGYIENKPFEKIIFNGIIESDNTIVYNYNPDCTSLYISFESREILHFTEYFEEQEITLNWPNIKVYWNGVDMVVITNLSDNTIDFIKNNISFYGYNSQLPSSSIDNSVIKTFPQTLSDTDKNQALANLGIPRVINADFYRIGGDMTIDELSEILGDCVTDEILIQGICYRTEHCTVYLPTLHQSYIKDGGGKVLSKLVCGQYRIDEEAYDTKLIVFPSIYIQYDEDSQLYTCLLEEY